MFFSAKAILEFFQHFYSKFNLVHYVRKKITHYCLDSVEIQLENEPKNIENCRLFRKLFKIEESINILNISAITYSKFNKTNSSWTRFIMNFDSFEFN